MRSTYLVIYFLSGVLLSSCSEWPPNKEDYVNHFNSHRHEIEALKALLETSKFDSVATKGSGLVWGRFYEGEPFDGQVAQEGRPDNSEEWARLFSQAGLSSISFNDGGGVSLPVGNYIFKKGLESYASYVNGPTAPSTLRYCAKDMSSANCGACMVKLHANWWITYGWWPSDLTEKEFLLWQDGELTEGEFYRLQGEIYDQCMAAGGTLIGERNGQ